MSKKCKKLFLSWLGSFPVFKKEIREYENVV